MNYFYIILFPACYLFLNLVEKGKIKGKTYFIFSFVFIISVHRVTNKGYQLDFINVISAILLFPVLIKYFSYIRFKGGNKIYILLIEYIISFLVIELFVLFFIKQINLKSILSKESPNFLSDTDERLLLITNSFWSVSVLFYYFGSEFVLMSFILSALPATAYMYFITGLGKIQISWSKHNVISFLNKCSTVQLNWFTLPNSLLAILNKSLYIVLIFEISSIFFLFPLYPKITFFYIGSLCIFHLTVLVACGINFWKWILSNLILMFCIYLVQFNYTHDSTTIFSSISIFLLGILYFHKFSDFPIKLSWLDSPLARIFSVYLVDDKKNMKRITPYDFFPFDTLLSQNRLQFLFPKEKYITGCLGSVQNQDLYNNLKKISLVLDNKKLIKNKVWDLINSFGTSPDIEESNQNYNNFINFIINNTNIFSKKKSILSILFSHIHSMLGNSQCILSGKIVEVRFILERKFYSQKLNLLIPIQKIQKSYIIKDHTYL